MASNSPFGSNSVSALLKSSQTAAAKIQSLTDSQIAYDWSQSAKSADDFATYSQYLNQRMDASGDPSDVLSLQKTLSSAQSGYISNEIQRQSQAVIEGDQDNQTKYSNVQSLYYQALNSGNYDAAQSIRGTLDSLSVTIQNENKAKADAGQALAKTLAAADARSVDDYVNQADKAVDTINSVIKSSSAKDVSDFLGDTNKLKSLGLDVPKGAGYFDILASIASAKVGAVDNALSIATDPDNIAKFQKMHNDLAENGVVKIPTKTGMTSLSMQDIQDQLDAARVGQSLFQEVASGNGTYYEPTKVSGYVFGRTADGNYRLIANRSGAPDYTSNVAGKNGAKQSYKDLVKQAGFTVTGSGDNLQVLNDKGQFDKYGIQPGQAVDLTVDPQGNLQFVNGGKAYNFGFDNVGKYTGLFETTPNPINNINDQFNNDFLSTLDPNSLNAGSFATIDTTSKFARDVQPGTILGQALQTQIQLQKSAAAAKLQASLAAPGAAPSTLQNANVNPASLPANASISIAKPVAPPAIKVVAPAPLPNLKVNNTGTNQTVKVNNTPNNQTIKV